MSGKFSACPVASAMSLTQRSCEPSGSTDKPMTFASRLSNSPFRRQTSPGSVVQTGVKSFGCEERSPRLCAGQRQLWPQRDGLATPGPGDDPLRKQQPPEPSGRAYQADRAKKAEVARVHEEHRADHSRVEAA